MPTYIRQVKLPEFQQFLRNRGLASETHIPYYARWAEAYIEFIGQAEAGLPFDISLERFIKHMSIQGHLQGWQISQAQQAVRLFHTYKDHSNRPAPVVQPAEPVSADDTTKADSGIMDKLKEAMRIRHYSYSTERSYGDWIRRFGEYMATVRQKADPVLWEADDVRDYLSKLAVVNKVSASTQNQAFNALLFLFSNVLTRDMGEIRKTVRAKRGTRLPVVLSPGEVKQVINAIEPHARLMLELLYGTGMRLMEMARLRVQDIDFANGTLFIRAAKGDKDRTTMLPRAVHERLRTHLEGVKKQHDEDLAKNHGEVYLPDALEQKYPAAAKDWRWQYVFPSNRLSVDPRSGKVRRHHLSDTAIQKTMARAVQGAGIAKHATVHTLRHSFATHLLMKGVNIREVQDLLGHKSVESTMVYTHVMRRMSNAPQSPLDDLTEEIKNA